MCHYTHIPGRAPGSVHARGAAYQKSYIPSPAIFFSFFYNSITQFSGVNFVVNTFANDKPLHSPVGFSFWDAQATSDLRSAVNLSQIAKRAEGANSTQEVDDGGLRMRASSTPQRNCPKQLLHSVVSPVLHPPFEYYARVLCRQRLVGASITHRKGQWREPSYLLPPEQQAAPGVA